MIEKLYLLIILIMFSCNNTTSVVDKSKGGFVDTIHIVNMKKLISCCKVERKAVELTFFGKFKVVQDVSVNGGNIYRKTYAVKDSIEIEFLYESSSDNQESEMRFYAYKCESQKSIIKDTTYNEHQDKVRLVKCSTMDNASFNLTRFNKFGYFSIGVNDVRQIPFTAKDKQYEQFFSRIIEVDEKPKLDKKVFNLEGKKVNLEYCYVINGKVDAFYSKNEIIVLINEESDRDCMLLQTIANCIFRVYNKMYNFNDVAFMQYEKNENSYKLVGKFMMRDHVYLEDSLDITPFYAECLWLDSLFFEGIQGSADCE